MNDEMEDIGTVRGAADSPSHADHSNLDSRLDEAIQLFRAGRLNQAVDICTEALQKNKNHPAFLHLLGVLAYHLDDAVSAVEWIEKAIDIDRTNPVYRNSLGNVFQETGKLAKAISLYEQALRLNPKYVEAHYNLGNAFHGNGESDKAISCYEKAIQHRPDYADAHKNLGSILQEQGRPAEAMACYQQALQRDPRCVKTYLNLGTVFQDLGKLEQAIQCYRHALELEPDLVFAHNNLGTILKDLGELDEAIDHLSRSTLLDDRYWEGYYNLGDAYRQRGDLGKAISCYQKGLALRPNDAGMCAGLVDALLETCSWHGLEALSQKLDRLTDEAVASGNRTGEEPLLNLARHPDPARNLAVASSWSHDIATRMSQVAGDYAFGEKQANRNPITVGYVSHDFGEHPVSRLMLGLYGLHDRKRFKILCYSTGMDDGSVCLEKIRRDCDRFVDIRNLGFREAADRIYKDGVDILIDLNGHTEGGRLEIFALRPAPVQVTYLGFPGTTGADFIDYIITDRIVTPEDHRSYYTEIVLWMPHCYMVTDHTQEVPANHWEKRDWGLPEDRFLFSSFNQPYKIEPNMFDVWMAVLDKVPNGVLCLQQMNAVAQGNLRQEAAKRGVSPDRLIFAERLSSTESHLARLRACDLALDTKTYNGHATTHDALWAGTPVVTLQGGHFASRVSSSLLTAIGLPELITRSLEDYEALAVRLARNPDQLQEIRQRLERNRVTEPLFDTPRFVRNLERAFEKIWQAWLSKERLRQIDVMES